MLLKPTSWEIALKEMLHSLIRVIISTVCYFFRGIFNPNVLTQSSDFAAHKYASFNLASAFSAVGEMAPVAQPRYLAARN